MSLLLQATGLAAMAGSWLGLFRIALRLAARTALFMTALRERSVEN